MTVRDFVQTCKGDVIFRLIDADQRGYASNLFCIIEADRNVIAERYGDCEFVGFDPISKKVIALYARFSTQIMAELGSPRLAFEVSELLNRYTIDEISKAVQNTYPDYAFWGTEARYETCIFAIFTKI